MRFGYAFDEDDLDLNKLEISMIVSFGSQQDTLVSVERLHFSDETRLAFDNIGNAGQIYRLYKTAFNRTPDAEGFAIWLGLADDGMPLTAIA